MHCGCVGSKRKAPFSCVRDRRSDTCLCWSGGCRRVLLQNDNGGWIKADGGLEDIK